MSDHSTLHEAAYAVYEKHWARVMPPGQDDPRRIWHRTLRSLDRTHGDLVRSLPAGARVLELGCGSGTLLRWLSEYHPHVKPVGVDVSAGQIATVRSALPLAEVYQNDGLEFLRQHPSEFAGVFCFHLLEHLPDAELVAWVRSIYSALSPGGFFCCRTPNAANVVGLYHRYDDLTHTRVFANDSLLQLMDIAGFAEARIVPIRAGWPVAWVRSTLEYVLHRMLFLISGNATVRHFSTELCAVARRPMDQM